MSIMSEFPGTGSCAILHNRWASILFILYLNELVRLLRDYQCPSIRIDNDFPDFSMLMYADDIALCNDTVGRLQRSIDILGIFCDKYGLKVNMSKTNVIVFRNGGILRQNEKFYYKGGQITSHIL